MASINPYIHFNGNCEEAFNFYKSVFGGEFVQFSRFKDIPNPYNPNAESEAEKIMHVALSVGNTLLMGSDTPSFMGTHNLNENRSKIVINVQNKEEADKIFSLLSIGANVEMPLGISPWGSYFGMFRDKYGIEWMINCDLKK